MRLKWPNRSFRRTSLLALALLVFVVSLPIGHAGSSITFKTKTSIATVTGTTASGSISAATGDTIIVNIYGVGAFNSFAVSDGTNSYSQRVASITANGALFSTYIWAATVSVAASLTVTITTGGATRTYAATLLDYSGVSGFGVTATDQNDAPSCISNSCTSTVTLTNTAGVGSAIVENFDDVWNFATQTNTYNNGQTQRDTFLCLQGSFEPCFSYDSLAPGTTFSLSTTFSQGPGSGSPSGWSHSALELLGTTTNPSTTITQCFGNCGSPAITLANTNSTHTTNFNQSITLLYEFQSSLNGYLLNVTTNVAKSYKAIPNGPSFGVYLVTSCPIGQSPFTPQCPGVLSTQSGAQNFFSPAKGRASFSGLLIPVSNGQWIGIAMTAFFSGFDVNDTNTSVNLFQTNEGAIPSTIQAAALLGSSKMGLWAWIRGNVVTSGQPTPPPACGSGLSGLLDCMIPQWVASLCSNPTASCINTSGLIWAGGLAIFFSFFTVRGLGEMLPGQKYPIGEIFMFWALVWIFVMSGLSQVFAWVPIFFFFLISLFVGKKTGVYL